MTKIALIFFGVVMAGLLLSVSPFVYDGFRSSSQRRGLQSRADYPQIATACRQLTRALTNASKTVPVHDPRVPASLRSLAPRYILASSNEVTMEFHGGMDHYGYKLRQSNTNPKQWTLSYYTEQGDRLLTTITDD